VAGRFANPTFLGGRSAQANAFQPQAFDIYCHGLDGTRLRTSSALSIGVRHQCGRADLLDHSATQERTRDAWLAGAADQLTGGGFGDRVTLDTSATFVQARRTCLLLLLGSTIAAEITAIRIGVRARRPRGTYVRPTPRTLVEAAGGWTIGTME